MGHGYGVVHGQAPLVILLSTVEEMVMVAVMITATMLAVRMALKFATVLVMIMVVAMTMTLARFKSLQTDQARAKMVTD